jgi:DNA-binding NtrC family response regulator
MAAVPEALAESELFGHVAGSFTGATQSRGGRFEAAHGGSLFIDEVGDFPLTAQAKLLRALETLTVTPVGSDVPRRIDTRLIAATSCDLAAMVAAGSFRGDLYYRLNVITIRIPPLRERREDIPVLVARFLQEFAEAHGKLPLTVDDELQELLGNQTWPGNVRELRNLMERMVVMAQGPTLGLVDAPEELLTEEPRAGNTPGILPAGTLQEIERSMILEALTRHRGNRTRTAAELGISVRTLQRKFKAWGIPDGEAE